MITKELRNEISLVCTVLNSNHWPRLRTAVEELLALAESTDWVKGPPTEPGDYLWQWKTGLQIGRNVLTRNSFNLPISSERTSKMLNAIWHYPILSPPELTKEENHDQEEKENHKPS